MIDQHGHPFALSGGPLDLASISLDVRSDEGAAERRRRDGPNRVFQELLTARLAGRLGCRPEDLAEARAEASAEWPAYCSGLFTDAGITDLVLDAGYLPGGESYLDDYASLSGCAVHPIFRLDPLVDRLIGRGSGAEGIVSAVEDAMGEAVAGGAVGFKTIAAYRTGLRVDPGATLSQAEASLRQDAGEPVRRRAKPLRDLVLRRALGVAADLGRPVQFHTGLGDSDIRLSESDPLLLEELLRSPEGSAATVVLIHGAYPWHEQLAHMTAITPNVHAEMSLHQLFSPVTTPARLLRLLDMAPANKILLGTDGHAEPELFWFAALMLRRAWAAASEALREAGASKGWLERVEAAIFEENARRLYGI